jgi:hypothetical protein
VIITSTTGANVIIFVINGISESKYCNIFHAYFILKMTFVNVNAIVPLMPIKIPQISLKVKPHEGKHRGLSNPLILTNCIDLI